jgi:hypothetical protein
MKKLKRLNAALGGCLVLVVLAQMFICGLAAIGWASIVP